VTLGWQVISMSALALCLQFVISLRRHTSAMSEGVNGRTHLAEKIATRERGRGSLANSSFT
jgi:hypothetical protein